MKIYICIHGMYENERITLCTTDFKLAIKHFIDYYNQDTFYNSMTNIEVWEDNKQLFCYGDLQRDIVNYKKDVTYKELEKDFIEQMNDKERI